MSIIIICFMFFSMIFVFYLLLRNKKLIRDIASKLLEKNNLFKRNFLKRIIDPIGPIFLPTLDDYFLKNRTSKIIYKNKVIISVFFTIFICVLRGKYDLMYFTFLFLSILFLLISLTIFQLFTIFQLMNYNNSVMLMILISMCK